MFVAENGNGTPARCENTADLLEHIPAWIHVLPDLIVWIISVFTNEQDTINGKFILMEYEYKNNTLTHDFSDNVITDTADNDLKVIVTDNVGNTTSFMATFHRKY